MKKNLSNVNTGELTGYQGSRRKDLSHVNTGRKIHLSYVNMRYHGSLRKNLTCKKTDELPGYHGSVRKDMYCIKKTEFPGYEESPKKDFCVNTQFLGQKVAIA